MLRATDGADQVTGQIVPADNANPGAALGRPKTFTLGGSPMTDEKIIAPGATGMLQATSDWINPCGVSIGVFRHPAACFAMHQPTVVADEQQGRVLFRHDTSTSGYTLSFGSHGQSRIVTLKPSAVAGAAD